MKLRVLHLFIAYYCWLLANKLDNATGAQVHDINCIIHYVNKWGWAKFRAFMDSFLSTRVAFITETNWRTDWAEWLQRRVESMRIFYILVWTHVTLHQTKCHSGKWSRVIGEHYQFIKIIIRRLWNWILRTPSILADKSRKNYLHACFFK